jgi:hypothetical protein
MGDQNQGVIHSASAGGVVGEHPDVAPFQILAGPATGSEFNTVVLPLIPTNCWRVEDVRFAFDSSFVTYSPDPSSDPTSDPLAKPFSDKDDIRRELTVLAGLVHDNPGCPLGVFGHADPEGPPVNPDDYNKALSGRRATAVYALLIANQELAKAVSLWQRVATAENWGANQRQKMQDATGLPDGTSMNDLITSYLQKLCPQELSLGSKDFLAQGADSAGKGDYQGCSSFNPLLLFSQKDQDDYDQGERDHNQNNIDTRNTANAPNRRVMVLMFKKGSKVDPAKWPCPRATEGIAGCKKRFCSNGEKRRTTRLPDKSREYKATHDTFACRFYDRISGNSPCENVMSFGIRLYDETGAHIPGAPCKITLENRDPYDDKATPDPDPAKPGATRGGIIFLRDVVVPQECHIEWGRKPEPGEPPKLIFSSDMLLVSRSNQEEEARRKLNNLGYIDTDFGKNVKAFQLDYGLDSTGQPNEPTTNLLTNVYRDCNDRLRNPKASENKST